MLNNSSNGQDTRQALSALMDGELPPAELRRMVQAWHLDADARASWHAYHLAGDVLRSDELASLPSHDVQFLRRLRDRLALEPVPLATDALGASGAERAVPALAVSPLVAAAPAARVRHRMLGSAAVAAGVMSVAGALLWMRPTAPPHEGASLVAGGATVPPPTQQVQVQQAGMSVVRDARLDRYLQAHRKTSSNMLQAPGASGQAIQVVFEKP